MARQVKVPSVSVTPMPLNEWVGGSVSRQSFRRSIIQSTSQSIRHSFARSVSQTVSQPDRADDQSANLRAGSNV